MNNPPTRAPAARATATAPAAWTACPSGTDAPARTLPAGPRPRILCVDDEEDVLDTLRRALGTRFSVDTAPSGEAALELIEREETYAAVLSDRKMPGMDGVAFLAECRIRAPGTARLLFTAQLDLELAVRAVNDAEIFRLLKKPCRREALIGALEEAVASHRGAVREQALREQAVRGSIAMLRGVVALLRPDLGRRADRIAGYVSAITGLLGMGEAWAYEAAAIVAPLSSLDAEGRYVRPAPEDGAAAEPHRTARAGRTCEDFLAAIPGLETVADTLRCRERAFDGPGSAADGPRGEAIPFGARVLRVAMDFEDLEEAGVPADVAIARLRSRRGRYDPNIVSLLELSLTEPVRAGSEARELSLASLEPGMVLAEDVFSTKGVLLLRKGQEMTEELLDRVHRLQDEASLRLQVHAIVPCLSLHAR